MNLDAPTLGAVFALNTAILAALLLFSWALNRQVQALAWWGLAFLFVLIAMGLLVLAQGIPKIFTLLIANAVLALAYGVLYGGCRVFNGRPATLLAIFMGAAIWCVAFPVISGNAGARHMLMSAIAAGYSALSAWELWRHARQRLGSQLIAIMLLICLFGFNVLRAGLGFSLAQVFWIDAFARQWSAQMAVAAATLMPTLAFIFLSMAKEQVEYEYRQAALVDPLTKIPNRRAFFQKANALLVRQRNVPVSCLLFDLDNFKGLNDRFGHEVGDHVLEIFGRVLTDHLPNCVFGRLGGEEFGAIMLLGKPEAAGLAEEIRDTFASIAKTVRGFRVDVTVSVGCATGVACTIQDLLHEADVALYRAKALGRNMVAAIGSGEL